MVDLRSSGSAPTNGVGVGVGSGGAGVGVGWGLGVGSIDDVGLGVAIGPVVESVAVQALAASITARISAADRMLEA